MNKITLELCRSVLFTPANRLDRYEKAGTLKAADCVVLDLEDAVPAVEKDMARKTLINYLEKNTRIPSDHPMLTAIRINAISTIFGLKDIVSVVDAGIVPDAIFLPKVENAQEIDLYSSLLNDNGLDTVPFVAAIETAFGMQHAHEIATRDRIIALGFGGGDLAADLGVKLTFENTIAFRSRIVQAARYAGKAVWDVPYLNINDDEGLRRETQQVKDLGYTTKIAIHPSQLNPIVEILSPTKEEINRAQAIVKVYENAKGAACEYKGKMIDVPIIKRCKEILRRATVFN